MCTMCGSDEIVHLGQLGRRVHGRCRACGWDVSYLADEDYDRAVREAAAELGCDESEIF